MDVFFKNNKLQKTCNSEKESTTKYGKLNAKKIRLRLAQLHAAENLGAMIALPQAGFHGLKGRRKGQFTVDLKHPWRMVFIPKDNPLPRDADGGIDIMRLTKIEITFIGDYHG